MLAQLKHENGKYLIQVYRTDSKTGHKTWQTIEETEDQGLAIKIRNFCRCENIECYIDCMRAYWLSTHNK